MQQFGSLGGWDVGRLSMLDSLGIEVSHSLNCLSTQTYHDQLPCAHIAPRPLPSISDHHSPPAARFGTLPGLHGCRRSVLLMYRLVAISPTLKATTLIDRNPQGAPHCTELTLECTSHHKQPTALTADELTSGYLMLGPPRMAGTQQCRTKPPLVAVQSCSVRLLRTCHFVCDTLLVLIAGCDRCHAQSTRRKYSSSGCLGNCHSRYNEHIQHIVDI